MKTRLLLLLMSLVFLLVACERWKKPDNQWREVSTSSSQRPEALSSAVEEEFGRALRHYLDGRYEDALEGFRLVVASYPGDPLIPLAELHEARVLVSLGRSSEAANTFTLLAELEPQPELRDAARLYRAFVTALQGESSAAYQMLGADLGANPGLRVPGEWVVQGDTPLLASLLAETRIRQGDIPGALFDLAMVAEEARDGLHDYAVSRALEIAESGLDEATLSQIRGGEHPFVIAATAPARARIEMSRGELENARQILLDAEIAAADWGLPERIAESLALVREGSTERQAKIGLVVSLTGANRRAGRAALGAVLLAQRAFEERPAGSTILIRDAQSTPQGAQQAVDELIAEGVSAILGPIEADLARVNHGNVPLVTLSSVPQGREVQRSTWRWMLDPVQEADAVISEGLNRNVRRWVIVEPSSAAGSGFFGSFADAVEERLGREGAWVLAREQLESSADDATVLQGSAQRVARAIARTEAEGVILALPADETATLAAWMAAENIWPSRDGSVRNRAGRRQVTYGTTSFALSEVLLRNSASYLEGVIIPLWFDPELATGAAREFADRFVATFGRDAGVLEAFAFDATNALRRIVLDEAISSPAAVSSRLQAGVEINGVVGPLRFDSTGNANVAPRLCTIRGGRFVEP